MKAIAIYEYGSTSAMHYTDVADPPLQPDQVRVKVRAIGVNPVDWKIREGVLKVVTGKDFPRVLGSDLAGEVVEVGSQVTDFKPGDAIYGSLNALKGGAYAEYAVLSTNAIAPKPANINYEEAAAIPVPGLTALQALRDQGKIQTGQKVLINGASGGVGTLAVQIAKAYGAEVTGVCSGKNIELVESLGCDRIINYKQDDFTKGSERYQIIFDTVAKRSFDECKPVMTSNGIYVTTLPSAASVIQGILSAILPGKKLKFVVAKPNRQDFLKLNELMESGQMRVVVDRTYPLSDAAEAHAYSETEHAAGKIILVPDSVMSIAS